MYIHNLFISVLLSLSFSMSAQDMQVSEIIKSKIDAGIDDNSIAADGIILHSQKMVSSFYSGNNYQQSWADKKNIAELLDILNDSYNEGLTPSDYHLARINDLMTYTSSNNDSNVYADLDLILTDAIMMYAIHLIIGKVDQNAIRPGWDIPQLKVPEDSQGYLERALDNKQLNHLIEEIRPNHFMYRHLKIALGEYREIAENGGWPKVPVGDVLKLDVKDPRNLLLRDYLRITGDLLPSTVSENDSVYDSNLEEAVIRFQFRHNLNQDGVVGKGTLALINVPIEKRIDEIRINMERSRWVTHHLPQDFLVVNIAGFNIRRITNDSTVFYSRVIVGKHFHETPIFDGTMTYIEINPTWTLPYSISTKETLPKLKKNPDYLADKNMIIMDRDGKELDPSTIDFNDLSTGNFPYILRQKAGPNNSLGEVKFMFPNTYSVYLHDTPARSLFAREDRAFSHGCIRLDEKWELLMNLMGPDWDMERINEVVESQKTTRVNLPQAIEIILLYWTAGADKQDRVFFNKDVYDRDSKVLEGLNEPMTYKKAH